LLALLDERRAPLLLVLALQVLDDARLDLLERLAADLRLVLLVDLLDVLVRRLGRLLLDLLRRERFRRRAARGRLALQELLRDQAVEALAKGVVALVLDLDQLRPHLVFELRARDLLVAHRGDRLVGRPRRPPEAEHRTDRERRHERPAHACLLGRKGERLRRAGVHVNRRGQRAPSGCCPDQETRRSAEAVRRLSGLGLPSATRGSSSGVASAPSATISR